MSQTFTSKAAAEYLGISLSTLFRIEKRGLLSPFMTPGGHRRYGEAELQRYIESSRGIKSTLNPSQYKLAAVTPAELTPEPVEPKLVAEDPAYTAPVASVAGGLKLVDDEAPESPTAIDSAETSERSPLGVNAVALKSWQGPTKVSQHLIDLNSDQPVADY